MNPALAVYLSLSLGGSFANGQVVADPPGSPENSAGIVQHGFSPTIRGAIGLSLGRWDMELGGGVLAEWQVNRDLSAGEQYDTSGYNLNANEVDVRLRYNLPITNRWSASLEGGAAWVKWNSCQWKYCQCASIGAWHPSSGSDIAPQVGAGIGYELSEHWKVQASVLYTPVSELNVTQVLVGVRWQP